MLTVLLLAAPGAGILVGAVDGFDDVARPFLEAHCVRCHGGTTAQGDLDLAVASGASVLADPDAWDWLAERVEFEEMPPTGESAPTADERRAFLEWLRGELAGTRAGPLPLAAVPLRRLTRIEYESAAAAVCNVSIDASRFLPEDAVGHGFDHVAAAQSLSEVDFVRFLEAAEAVAERAIPIDEPGPPRVRRYAPSDMVGGTPRRDARWLSSRGTTGPLASLPRAGEYLLRAEAFGQQAGPDPCRARLVLGDGSESTTFDVAAGPADDGVVLEARLRIERGGDHLAGVRFVNDYYVPRSAGQPASDRNLAVRWIEVVGPLGDAQPTEFSIETARAIAGAADERAGLRTVVRDLAALAWRGSVIDVADVDRLLSLSEAEDPAEVRLRTALVGLFVSPRFLFKGEVGREEPVDDRGSTALAPHEVATRLAGFLWNSVPDEPLLASAAAGELDDAAGVRAVALAMLDDPRADRFVLSFGEQWLQLRVLQTKRADRGAYPSFSGALANSMREETRRVLVDSLRQGRSLWELVDGDETFVDERLSEMYGVTRDDVIEDAGAGWSRVSLARTERRGLLGHASVLFATSESTRTSPVRRGKWVLEVLLGSAPPPPPPGAGSLPENEEGAEVLSLRERFELHRRDPTCAACHDRMDPLGFGLEAYDGIGGLRAADDPERGDVSGELPDGRTFEGPAELAVVLRGEDRFLEAFVERMFVYALGRGLERADRPSIGAIVDALQVESPTMRRAILGIVTAPEFLRLSGELVDDDE